VLIFRFKKGVVMKKKILTYTLGLGLLILSSCQSDADVSCEAENLDSLVVVGKRFIEQELEQDYRSRNITIDGFELKRRSCRHNKRKKYVVFTIKSSANDGKRNRRVEFKCEYGNIRTSKSGEIKSLCQMR
jgi:hypothetical protein